VSADNTLAPRAHEEDRPLTAPASGADSQLLPGSEADFQWSRRGLNNKAKVTMRKSYGFRTFRALELALYHSLGKLPEPESTHDFF
jgi:hypothetical protein